MKGIGLAILHWDLCYFFDCNNNFVSQLVVHKFGSREPSLEKKPRRVNKGKAGERRLKFKLIINVQSLISKIKQFKTFNIMCKPFGWHN